MKIAWRYLFSKKTHSAVNIISSVSVAGVALATATMVCVLSVFNGFSDLAYSQISELTPDLRVEPLNGKVIANADSLASIISKLESVNIAAPTLEERALAIYGGRQMPVRAKGVTDEFRSMVAIDSITKDDGAFILYDSVWGDFATISVGTALDLEARPGFVTSLELYIPRREGRINPTNPSRAFRSDTLFVGGVFQMDQAEFDTDMAIIPLEAMRHLLNYDTEASAIEIKVAPAFDIDKTADEISSIAGPQLAVKNRLLQQESSFKMIKVEKWITFLLLAFILLIASFNIISTLSMLVIEKEDSTRTLFAIGASRRTVSRIFFLEGWLISVIGGAIGIFTGVVLCLSQQKFGFIKLGGNHDMMTTDIYPVRIEAADLLAVVLLVAIVGWCTSTITSLFTRKRLPKGATNC
ncbi:MAG: ABC transporter permease [Muribaculum sp.]|nr:ABC transporter permease [Muribaculum sp.]